MNAPKLAIGPSRDIAFAMHCRAVDGAMGFWAALEETFSSTRQQRLLSGMQTCPAGRGLGAQNGEYFEPFPHDVTVQSQDDASRYFLLGHVNISCQAVGGLRHEKMLKNPSIFSSKPLRINIPRRLRHSKKIAPNCSPFSGSARSHLNLSPRQIVAARTGANSRGPLAKHPYNQSEIADGSEF